MSEREAAETLSGAYAALFGHPIPHEAAKLLLAQVWLEGGAGRAMWQHNWGNLAASASWRAERDYWRPSWYRLPEEPQEGASEAELASFARLLRLHDAMAARPPTVPEAFRAYATHADGARAYLETLARERFWPLLVAAEAGDAVAFALAARDTGYCPDCEPEATARTLASLAGGFEARGTFDGLSERGGTRRRAPTLRVALRSEAPSPWLGVAFAGAFLFAASRLPLLRKGPLR